MSAEAALPPIMKGFSAALRLIAVYEGILKEHYSDVAGGKGDNSPTAGLDGQAPSSIGT